MSGPNVLVASLGRGNVASMLAALRRAGADARASSDPADLESAPYAVLPGVGSFGAVAERLRTSGVGRAFAARVNAGLPTLAVCLGMQLMARSSRESPGARGLGILPAECTRFGDGLSVPQFGWNRVRGGGPGVAGLNWAYFANSYKLDACPPGWTAAWSDYGGPFVASLERGRVLFCQFHPELSGQAGLRLLRRWLGLDAPELSAAPGLAPRIIPCLDVAAGRVVKGTRFMDLRDQGDPAELAAAYERQGADELVVLNIQAGTAGTPPDTDTVARVRAAIGLPLCVGGGVRSLADAERVLAAGADKIAINSRAYRDPGLVEALAREFGSQACVVAIDAARGPDGRARVALDAGTTLTDEAPETWTRRAVALGAGEILLTSRDQDGTRGGYDLYLLAACVRAAGPVPVIASGGASLPDHVLDGIRAGAGAALLAGALHDGSLTVGDIKRALAARCVEVRL